MLLDTLRNSCAEIANGPITLPSINQIFIEAPTFPSISVQTTSSTLSTDSSSKISNFSVLATLAFSKSTLRLSLISLSVSS